MSAVLSLKVNKQMFIKSIYNFYSVKAVMSDEFIAAFFIAV